MNLKLFSFKQWIFNTPYRSVNRAYILSKELRKIQIDYRYYQYFFTQEANNYKILTYINIVLYEYSYAIYFSLIEFEISRFILCLTNLRLYNKNFDDVLFKKRHFYLAPLNEFFCQSLILSLDSNEASTVSLKKKIIWITSILMDLNLLQNQVCLDFVYNLIKMDKIKYDDNNIPNDHLFHSFPYEAISFIPRSIIRTLTRFKTELTGLSTSIVLTEFKLIRYQAIASIQYLLYLIMIPWITSKILKIMIIRPFIGFYWNIHPYNFVLNLTQEENLLMQLQEVEEILWLNIILDNRWKILMQNFDKNLQQKTFELLHSYNNNIINNILNLSLHSIQIGFIILILIWGKKRLAILNSWLQEAFYSLSDTMKAFCILLFTDLCIGFHSPHGWEIFIDWLLQYLGFSQNSYFISYLVSTVPVILDTIFKYWIFRHLNRISPSIVVTYHTMNE